MRKQLSASAREITPEQLATLKENAVGLLAEARKTLLNRFPFVGSIAMSLDLVPVRDCRIATIATDGKNIFCDIDFLSTLSNDDKIFILAHEIYHCVMLHLLRRDNRDHDKFNLATDMEVNNILQQDGLSVPRDAVTSAKHNFPDGLSAEEYYDMLLQNEKLQEQKSNTQNKQNGSSDGAGSASDGDKPEDDDADAADDAEKPNQSKDNGSGDKNGELKGQFDKHIYKDEQIEESGDETKQDRYGKIGYDPDFQPNATQQNVERVREAAVAAAQMIERQGGTLPGHVQKIVKQLLEPKLDWKEKLAQYVLKAAGESERTWNRPNRRFAGRGLYLPASQSNSVRIAVGIDTSGSVGEFSDKFMAELNGICSSFGNYEVTTIQCDTQVQKVDKFDNIENPLDCAKFQFHGFGGTRLQPIFNYVKDNDLDVSCIVVLTDGFVTDSFQPENAPDVPVLWCVTKGGSKKSLTFGEVCDLD